jgi:hypothetical protein
MRESAMAATAVVVENRREERRDMEKRERGRDSFSQQNELALIRRW